MCNQPDRLELRIQSIDFLANVRDTAIHSLTIAFRLEDIDEETLFQLSDIVEHHPGKAHLNFDVYRTGNHMRLQTVSTNRRIQVTSDLIDFIEKTPTLNYQIN